MLSRPPRILLVFIALSLSACGVLTGIDTPPRGATSVPVRFSTTTTTTTTTLPASLGFDFSTAKQRWNAFVDYVGIDEFRLRFLIASDYTDNVYSNFEHDLKGEVQGVRVGGFSVNRDELIELGVAVPAADRNDEQNITLAFMWLGLCAATEGRPTDEYSLYSCFEETARGLGVEILEQGARLRLPSFGQCYERDEQYWRVGDRFVVPYGESDFVSVSTDPC